MIYSFSLFSLFSLFFSVIFFIFKYYVQNKENRHLWIFFLKIPIRSWEKLVMLKEIAILKGKNVAMKMINMSFDIFPKYGQNFIIKVQKIHLLTFHWLEIMAQNYRVWKISQTLNLNISFGHCLHVGCYGFFESLLGLLSFHGKMFVWKWWAGANQWPKNHFLFKMCF